MWLFFTILVVQESDNFQLVFSEKYSTYRYIFNVFVGGGELHALLFYHLWCSPQNVIYIFKKCTGLTWSFISFVNYICLHNQHPRQDTEHSITPTNPWHSFQFDSHLYLVRQKVVRQLLFDFLYFIQIETYNIILACLDSLVKLNFWGLSSLFQVSIVNFFFLEIAYFCVNLPKCIHSPAEDHFFLYYE